MVVICSLFCPFLISIVDYSISIPVVIYLCAIFLTVVALTICCILFDPTDPDIKLNKIATLKENTSNNNSIIIYECSECKSFVCETTKHCFDCGKCIKDFDHHCVWLNKCIGFRNYKIFMVLIIAYSIYNISFFGVNLAVIIKLPEYYDYERSGAIVCQVLLSLLLLIKTLVTVAVLSLLCFHIMLNENKLTTYEYIKRSSKSKKEKDNQKNSPKQKIKSLVRDNILLDNTSNNNLNKTVVIHARFQKTNDIENKK